MSIHLSEQRMVHIERVDFANKQQIKRFVQLPHRLYKSCPQWVPPLNSDAYAQLNPRKHPFYEHSDVECFLAVHNGRDVGRIAALENRPYNQYHGVREANFYFFDCEHDAEAASALFDAVFDWANKRGLNRVVGPKGMGPLDGYGLLTCGFEHRQTMTMLTYNYPYYVDLVEGLGFQKEVDFVSCYLPSDSFKIPERIERIARRVMERHRLQVKHFSSKRELLQWVDRIGEAYNKAFIHNWEYYPLTERETDFVVQSIITVADHRLIKVITHAGEVVGFLFAFPDVSAALQRARGHLNPLTLADLLITMRRTSAVVINGMGILPEFQGQGGNALLYYEMGKTLLAFRRFTHVEMTQVAETARQMRADLKNLNGVEYKNNRVYFRDL